VNCDEVYTYTITVTNAGTVDLEDVTVVDDICSEVAYAGNATPDDLVSEPGVGDINGQIVWEFDSLPVGADRTFTFDVEAIGVPGELIPCANSVVATGYCADASDSDQAGFTTMIECEEPGSCWMTMGGHQNGGMKKGQKEDTFGGVVYPGNNEGKGSWEHIQRVDGVNTFNFHSWDLEVIRCYHDGQAGPCNPDAEFNVIEFRGTGRYNMGFGRRLYPATFVAKCEDHGEKGNRPENPGGCGTPDYYEIEVRDLGGELVFRAADFLDGGNIQIHKDTGHTPDPDETPVDEVSDKVDKTLPPTTEIGIAVESTRLYVAYPNPFRQSTRIAYAVEGTVGETVELDIFDVAGRRVRGLVSEFKNPGRYEAVWDGRDDRGASITQGVYFLRVRVGSEQKAVNRILYMR
jgi:uncharacterized repeat protein (TIGR01451 family)